MLGRGWEKIRSEFLGRSDGMDRMEWNGMGLGRRAGMLTWEEAEFSVLDLLCGVRSFISVFFILCALSYGLGPSLSRGRPSLLVRKMGSCASYGRDEARKYGITPSVMYFACCTVCDG